MDDSTLGCLGVVTVATRGADGPGEVLVKVRGGSETFLAWSENPLARQTPVLVVASRGTRTVDVVAWVDPEPGSLD